MRVVQPKSMDTCGACKTGKLELPEDFASNLAKEAQCVFEPPSVCCFLFLYSWPFFFGVEKHPPLHTKKVSENMDDMVNLLVEIFQVKKQVMDMADWAPVADAL